MNEQVGENHLFGIVETRIEEDHIARQDFFAWIQEEAAAVDRRRAWIQDPTRDLN